MGFMAALVTLGFGVPAWGAKLDAVKRLESPAMAVLLQQWTAASRSLGDVGARAVQVTARGAQSWESVVREVVSVRRTEVAALASVPEGAPNARQAVDRLFDSHPVLGPRSNAAARYGVVKALVGAGSGKQRVVYAGEMASPFSRYAFVAVVDGASHQVVALYAGFTP